MVCFIKITIDASKLFSPWSKNMMKQQTQHPQDVEWVLNVKKTNLSKISHIAPDKNYSNASGEKIKKRTLDTCHMWILKGEKRKRFTI